MLPDAGAAQAGPRGRQDSHQHRPRLRKRVRHQHSRAETQKFWNLVWQQNAMFTGKCKTFADNFYLFAEFYSLL